MSSLFQIGASGLMAAQGNLATTGHNIANVETPGFSRQRVEQSANIPQLIGGGYIGKGVQVAGIERVYNDFLAAQVREAGTKQSASQVLDTQIGRLSNLLGDESTGLSPVMADFFASIQDIAQHPTDTAARSTFLSTASTLAGRVRDIDGELQRLRKDANLAISRGVDKANTLIGKIATLNDQISLANNAGALPNDLLDQRDQLTRELGQVIKVSTFTLPDGAINVFMGSGQSLITGGEAYQLQAVPDPKFSDDLSIGLASFGAPITIPYASLGGGELSGYLTFRDGVLTGAQNELGRVAQALSASVNEQHRLGQDKYGALGGDLFQVGAPQAYSDTRNTGTGSVAATIVDSTQLRASDYLVRWDGANYSIRRLSDSTVQTFATLPQTVDGVQIAIAGAPAINDSYLVLPNRFAAQGLQVAISDPNRIAAASPIRTAATTANFGSGTISQATVIGPSPNPNLQQPVTLTFTGAATFDVSGIGTGNPTGVAFTAGGAITYNGWSVRIDGMPRAGDTFTTTSNIVGIGDASNAQQLGALQTRQVVAGETLSGLYGSMVANVGNDANGATIENDAYKRILVSAEEAHASVSGVNLDEEAANLLRYQSAYQAAARFIAIAGSLFEELLNSIR